MHLPKTTQLSSEWEEQKQANAGFNHNATLSLDRKGGYALVSELKLDREDVSEAASRSCSSSLRKTEDMNAASDCPLGTLVQSMGTELCIEHLKRVDREIGIKQHLSNSKETEYVWTLGLIREIQKGF